MDVEELLNDILIAQQQNRELLAQSAACIHEAIDVFNHQLLMSPLLDAAVDRQGCSDSSGARGSNGYEGVVRTVDAVASAAERLSIFPDWLSSKEGCGVAMEELKGLMLSHGYMLLRDSALRRTWKRIAACIRNLREENVDLKDDTGLELSQEILEIIEQSLYLNEQYH